MILTLLEMELLRKHAVDWQKDGGIVTTHDPRMGWPAWERGRVWEVPVPPELALVEDRSDRLCRMLRMRHDPDGNLPWAFVPGATDGSVWLVAADVPREEKQS